MAGTPFYLAFFYASLVGASVMVIATYSVQLYKNLLGRTNTALPQSAPDVTLYPDVERRDVLLSGEWNSVFVAHFFNNASTSGATARGVVARMTYYKEAPQCMCLPDRSAPNPLWLSTNGLWLPGKSGQVEFEPNEALELALVAIALEEKPTVYAVAHRRHENRDMEPVDFYSVHRDLPIIVDVELRALDMAARHFRFRVFLQNQELLCNQCLKLT